MSCWYTIPEEDINIDRDAELVDMYVTSDDSGSIYVMLSFDQIKELASQIDNDH